MEVFHETYHECIAPCMTFQMVHIGLLDIKDISQAQVRLLDGEIEGEELADGRLVMQRGETDILSKILGYGHFIVRLSVFR